MRCRCRTRGGHESCRYAATNPAVAAAAAVRCRCAAAVERCWPPPIAWLFRHFSCSCGLIRLAGSAKNESGGSKRALTKHSPYWAEAAPIIHTGRSSPSLDTIIRDVYGPKQPLQLAQRRLSSTSRLHGSCRCHHNPPHSISCTRCFRSSSSAGVCRRRRTSGSSRRAEVAALVGAVPPADVFSHATHRPSVHRLCRLCLSPSQSQSSRRPPPSS